MSDIKNSLNGELEEFLKEHYVPSDDISRLSALENEIMIREKACMLIYAGMKSDRFSQFLGTEKEKFGTWIVPLKTPIIVSREGFDFKFSKILIRPDSPFPSVFCESIDKHCVDHLKLHRWSMLNDGKIRYGFPSSISHSNDFDNDDIADLGVIQKRCRLNQEPSCNAEQIDIEDIIENANQKMKEKGLLAICQEVSRYDSPEKICNFWGNSSEAYSEIKTNGALRIDLFCDDDELEGKVWDIETKAIADLSEATLVQHMIDIFILHNHRSYSPTSFFEKRYPGIGIQAFSFKNKSGHIIQKVLKLIDIPNQGKALVPCTAWVRRNSGKQTHFCLPSPEKQPLFNLDILSGKENFDAVILCDDIEICELNQQVQNKAVRKNRIAWIGFLTPYEHLDKIDWTPLSQFEAKIYFLLTNHSGISLEQSYINAEKLRNHLRDEKDIQPRFIQIEMDYHADARPVKYFAQIDDIVKNHLAHKPEVLVESVRVISTEDFEKRLSRAKGRLTQNEQFSYQILDNRIAEVEPSSPVLPSSKMDAKKPALDYLLRPVLHKGKLHMIYAYRGTGKTNFTFSLCAAMAAGTPFLPDVWWTVPKRKESNDLSKKILFLNFESEKTDGTALFRDFAYGYFSTSKDKKEKQISNLIYNDCKELQKNLTNKSNHQQILDLIEKYTEEGNSIDLVVFDSYTKIVGGCEKENSYDEISPLFQQVMSRGTSILIIHHAKGDGSIRGFENKEDDFTTILSLKKNKKDNTLKNIKINFRKTSEIQLPQDETELIVEFDPQKRLWNTLYMDRTKNLKALHEEYKRHRFSRDAIAEMLGISKSTLHEKIK